MNILARMATQRSAVISRPLSRSFVKLTKPRLGGGEPHPTFEPPFNKGVIALGLTAVTVVGVGIPVMSCSFQNKKHGFPIK